MGTHWTVLCVNDNNATYFGSFGVEHIPKKLEKSQGIKMLCQIFIE